MEFARKGTKQLIVGIIIALIADALSAISSFVLPQDSTILTVSNIVVLAAQLLGGIMEIIGYRTAGKDCHYFRNAFKWQIFGIFLSVAYYVLSLIYIYNPSQEWLYYVASGMSSFELLVSVVTVWCLGRGCVQITDDDVAVTSLANVSLLLMILAAGISVICGVFKRMNLSAQTVLAYVASFAVVIGGIILIVLVVMGHKRIVVYDDDDDDEKTPAETKTSL